MRERQEQEVSTPIQLRGILTGDEVKAYRQPVAWREVVDFGLVWVQLLIGVSIYVWDPGIISYVVAAFLIGGGQHGLGLVSHEFIHYNGIPGNRALNDLVGTWFFAAPGGLPFELFRRRHFLHHRYYSTPEDTKTIYRTDIRGFGLWLEIFKNLTMFQYFYHVLAVSRRMRTESVRDDAGPRLIEILPPLVITHALIFVVLWPIHPLAYFFLWLGPLLALQTLFSNFRAITEHQPPWASNRGTDAPYFRGTAGPFVRTAGASWPERLFLCKINFGYHVEHHLWPQISYQHLPAVHARLLERNVFDDPRFGLERSFTTSILKLASRRGGEKQNIAKTEDWYSRPVAHEIAKESVPVCPLCDSPRKRFRYRVQEHEYDNTTDDWFNMAECLECGAWYLDPRPADSELGTIYPPNYYSNVLEASDVVDVDTAKKGVFHRLGLWMFKRRISPIEKHLQLTPQTRWLDIGCGFGLALESMYRVYGMRGVGVDMSERAVEICRRRGFEAHASKIENFNPPSDTKFHFIHSSHLIEHVASPVSYLRKVYDLLEPGGVTVVITPNTNTWESALFRRHWGGLHVPRHWVLFNASCAVRAAERVGFEHLETTFSTNSQFWIWSFHSLLGTVLPRGVIDALLPSDHRFVKSSIWLVLRGGFFTAVDMLTVFCTGRSSNMALILRKPPSR